MNAEFIQLATVFAKQNKDTVKFMEHSENPIDRALAEKIREAEKRSKINN